MTLWQGAGHMKFKLAYAVVVGLAAMSVYTASARQRRRSRTASTRSTGQARRRAVCREVLELPRRRTERRRDGAGLIGGESAANWNDLSIGDLFERMRISMPRNNPGSLSHRAERRRARVRSCRRPAILPAQPRCRADRSARTDQVRRDEAVDPHQAAAPVTSRRAAAAPAGAEQSHIGHDPNRLRRSPVGQLRHDRRIDVHAHHLHPRRRHVPTPMPCSIVDSESTSPTSCSASASAILRHAEVHDRLSAADRRRGCSGET